MSLWVSVRLERSIYVDLMKFRNTAQVHLDKTANKPAGFLLGKSLTISDAVKMLIDRVNRHRERGRKQKKKPAKKLFHTAANEVTREQLQEAVDATVSGQS